MHHNWNHPNQYRQQPQWQQHQGWNNHMNYNQGQQFYRQITIEEAMAIAMEQVPGQVVKVELDTEKVCRFMKSIL